MHPLSFTLFTQKLVKFLIVYNTLCLLSEYVEKTVHVTTLRCFFPPHPLTVGDFDCIALRSWSQLLKVLLSALSHVLVSVFIYTYTFTPKVLKQRFSMNLEWAWFLLHLSSASLLCDVTYLLVGNILSSLQQQDLGY